MLQDTSGEDFIVLSEINREKREEARSIVSTVHPAWHKCSEGAKKMHTRNVFQVLGQDLNTKSEIVICWTPNGKIEGGTATAIQVAKMYDIPVWNLGTPDHQNIDDIF